jgi:hypothetical protein
VQIDLKLELLLQMSKKASEAIQQIRLVSDGLRCKAAIDKYVREMKRKMELATVDEGNIDLVRKIFFLLFFLKTFIFLKYKQ